MMVSITSQTSFIFLFLLFSTTFRRGICKTDTATRCNENDRGPLLIFKQGVVDPLNTLSSWTSQQDCCLWFGISCDINGRVSELDLANHGLQGGINLSLLQLELLIHLDLSFNQFEYLGNISQRQVSRSAALLYLDFSYNYHLRINDPHWLSQLSSLKYLDLSQTDIGNKTNWLQYMSLMPSLSELRLRSCGLTDFPSLNYVNFTSLVTLDLSYNILNSELPDSLFNFTQQISYLDLSVNKFYGQVPMNLFKLPNLKRLVLRSNYLKGSLPDWFCQHQQQLQYFMISDNLFNGSIPSCLGNLSSLISLDLSNNNFSGNLPQSLGKLHNLESLGIGGNSWVGVLSEKNFTKLSNLTWLDLSSSGFKFDFDPKWVPSFQLEYLNLGDTRIGPNVPTWLYTQRSLKHLNISTSGISTIDVNVFWSLASGIRYLDLSNNLISADISNVTIYTKSVYLEYNNFTGGLPHISANVSEFRASHNSFSGSISPLLCHRESNKENMLYALDLSYNHLTGILPDCWANWKQLDLLDLHSNKLTGEVPPSMASLNLGILDLRDNSFFGKFSLDVSNWTNLQYLLLEGNEFSGSLPTTMPPSLVVIKLRANQFIGKIPLQLCNLSSLMILDLADNKLSGPIPHCLYNIMDSIGQALRAEIINIYTKRRELDYKKIWLLRVIDLSSNNLSGEIPKELFSMNQMWSLNLSWNHLIGNIPREIGGMTNLESLDLSHNRLSGEIPFTISNLSFLAWLNLSYNNLYGKIPMGTQIQSFDSWSFVGNLNLCGDPLPENCNKKEDAQHSKPAEENEYDTFLKALYLGMGVGFAAGFWAACGSLFLIRAWRHKFFRFFDHLIDQLYVAVVLKFKSFREILGTNCR